MRSPNAQDRKIAVMTVMAKAESLYPGMKKKGSNKNRDRIQTLGQLLPSTIQSMPSFGSPPGQALKT